MHAMSDEEIGMMIEDYETSDAWDDSVALCQQEMDDMDADERAERVAVWQRQRANVTANELPAYLLKQKAAVALSGLACQIMTRGSISSRDLIPYAMVWMERVGAIEHDGGVDGGGSLWWRVESESLRRQAGKRGLVWLCLTSRGLALKVPPGEVISLAAARAIPELSDEERAIELERLRLRIDRQRRQSEARRRAGDDMEAREAAMFGFGQVEVAQ